MPCLNEAATVGTLRREGARLPRARGHRRRGAGRRQRLDRRLARARRARPGPAWSQVAERGYGAALRGGIAAARGRYVIMGDADDSYDFGRLEPFVEKLRAGLSAGDGQPLQGRHPAGRDAAAAPLSRQPGAELRRPAVLPRAGRRLPLRPARLRPRGASARSTCGRTRHGVRERDGGQGGARRLAHRRGADHAAPGRPRPAAAPAQLARRLAAPALPAAVQPALAVPLSRARAARARHAR